MLMYDLGMVKIKKNGKTDILLQSCPLIFKTFVSVKVLFKHKVHKSSYDSYISNMKFIKMHLNHT